MEVVATTLADVKLVRPRLFVDDRGAFHETYSRDRYAAAGIDVTFVQDNHALSSRVGTVRGLHFQRPPAAQAKLVWVVRGAVLDVVVDVRHGAPTFGRFESFRLDADASHQVFVPEGFAHGYCTLEAPTVVVYKVSRPYSPEHEGGVLWSDPDLAIPWPVAAHEAVVAERDENLPRLADLSPVFSQA
jgi:dTDP-4-dehydrorhamnose 3,5-epimerase